MGSLAPLGGAEGIQEVQSPDCQEGVNRDRESRHTGVERYSDRDLGHRGGSSQARLQVQSSSHSLNFGPGILKHCIQMNGRWDSSPPRLRYSTENQSVITMFTMSPYK